MAFVGGWGGGAQPRTRRAVGCQVRGRAVVMKGEVDRETGVQQEEGTSKWIAGKGWVSVEEKAAGNGTVSGGGMGGPAKAVGYAWPGMLVGTAAQALPLFAKTPFADASYFFLVAVGALYAGGKRNPTEIPVDDLSPQQALLAPFIAGSFLVGAYLLLRYTNIDISQIFQYATTVFGGVCLKEALDPVLFTLFTKLNLQPITRAVGEGGCEEDEESWYSPKNVVSSIIAGGLTLAYFTKTGPTFFFSNILGFGLGIRAISLLKPKTVWSASALLVGLLLYDVFFVFGTDVMVSVATSIEAPAKFVFPREVSGTGTGPGADYPFAILGLGDVVIPGIFASIMAFVDKELVFGDEREVSHVPNGPYFSTAIASYIVGLFTTFFVNTTTRAAQPALLYLVPALLGGALITSSVRGELSEVVKFERKSQTSMVEREKEEKLS